MEDNSNTRIVTNYDFKHPARVNKDQLRTLENLHDNFARLRSNTFSKHMRAGGDGDTAFVAQVLAGFTYHITPNLAATVGYRGRFIGATSFSTVQSFRSSYFSSGDVGLRLSF